MNIAIFASGNGSNLQAIINAVKKRTLKCNIALVVSDNPKAFALKRARKAGIKTFYLDPKLFKTREAYDSAVIAEIENYDIELIVLAGFMRILSGHFVKKYSGSVMNVHPSLLPAFKGTHGIKDAFLYGVKVTGVTVHFVDDKLDHGPVILQEPVEVEKKDTLVTLEKKIHKTEHKLYPIAIKLFVSGKLRVKGRIVKIG